MNVLGRPTRTIWPAADGAAVEIIDQTRLPHVFVTARLGSLDEAAHAIRAMLVRGAPLIGATAAWGMWLALRADASDAALERDRATLLATRPTAVNLRWALDRVRARVSPLPVAQRAATARALAVEICDEDVALNRRMGFYGAELIADGDTILHHCNTGALATVDWGTALGVVFAAHEQGKRIHVLVDETRPRLQGARLTAWELQQRGIPFDLIADNAAGHFMRRGEVNLVLVGSDRTAANGDVANKIGTYQLGVLARENGVPFYPVVPTSTIDLDLATGDLIPIEERSMDEVLTVIDTAIAPAGITARNPAFDVTPHRYVTGIITEAGIVYPPFEKNLRAAVVRAREIKWDE